jgi:preprotein translocase subunit SecG
LIAFCRYYFSPVKIVMNLELTLNIAQLILAVLLVAAILLQARGTGLGAAFGGGGNVYRTKRGAEKKIFQMTIILSILFFGVALANALI